MSRHAIVDQTGNVVNVVVWHGNEWTPPRDHKVVHCPDGKCDIGDKWDDENQVFIYADRTSQ